MNNIFRVSVLVRAFFILLAVTNLLIFIYLNSIRSIGSVPEFGAAKGCVFQLDNDSSLDFGALVKPSVGTSSIVMSPDGTLTAQRDYSVGVNISNYAPTHGELSLYGSGLKVGKQFEVRLSPVLTNLNSIVDEIHLVADGMDGLTLIDALSNQGWVKFRVDDPVVSAKIFYGAKLTVTSAVSGKINVPMEISVIGESDCN